MECRQELRAHQYLNDGHHRIIPWSKYFEEKTEKGEPRHAMLLTGLLTGLTLVIAILGGGLNFVAPLITMFFLLTYAILNLVVLVELRLDMVSFRPTFRVHATIPLLGIFFATIALLPICLTINSPVAAKPYTTRAATQTIG